MLPRTLKLLIVAGARPNFMKVAPIIKAARAHNAALAPQPSTLRSAATEDGSTLRSTATEDGSTLNPQPHIDYKLVHTGQHYDQRMSDVFFQELGIPAPDFNLGVGSGSHAAQTARIMTAFEPVLLTAFSDSQPSTLHPQPSTLNPQPLFPDWVLVVGDVNSTVACTLVAAKLGVKVAHVEAGLRSFDRTMPEEINRLVTDSIADLLLTPSEDANENLRREGVPAQRVRLVGNIMIDALVQNLPKARQNPVLGQLNLQPGHFAYVTLHRPSNVDNRESLSGIIAELKTLSVRMPVVFPMHPRTRKMAADFGVSWNAAPGLKVIEPIGYHASLALTENARLVLTDSGGLQEEATYFRTPCLTLRPNTERPITLTLGSNRLTTPRELESDLAAVFNQSPRLGNVPPMWDGQAAHRSLQALLDGTGSPAVPALA